MKSTAPKRTLSLMLALLMALSLLPMPVSADDVPELSADLFGDYPFYPSAGNVSDFDEYGYTYTEWDYSAEPYTSKEKTIPLYTVEIPFGTSEVQLYFKNTHIAYSYDDEGLYTDSCAKDKSGGYASGGQAGETKAFVRADANGLLPDFVRVQTPYSEGWQSDTLYAVQFEYSHSFTARVGGAEMTDISCVPNAYEYFDWMADATLTVPVYVVTVPCGSETVDLCFSDNSLVYNYDSKGTYITGWYESAAAMTGEAEVTVDIDADDDGAVDYIQVQNIYSTYDNSTYTYVGGELYYAVTFRYFTAETTGDGDAPEASLTNVTYASTYPAATVPVYTVALSEGETGAVLSFADKVLVYNYDGNGNWLAGHYADDVINVGVCQTTVSADANDDGINDYILVQSPYDNEWNTKLWFAITFGAPAGESDGGAASEVDPDELMAGIAAGYVDSSDEWVIMDMAAYEDLKPNAVSKTSETAKQNYINLAVSSFDDLGWSPAQTYSKAELSLRSIGIDTTRLYGPNSNTVINSASLLKALDITSLYDAPWVLLANLQGNLALSAEQETALISLIKTNQSDSGLYGYEYDGKHYTDVDTTATIVNALASLYSGSDDAKAVVDNAITALSGAQAVNGSFGNANTDALVIVGLASMGINPDTDARFVKNGNSLLDGLLSFAHSDGDAFGHTTGATKDNLATEQGFRALIAAANVMSTGGAFNIYDFGHNTSLAPGRATAAGKGQAPEQPSGTDTMTVYLTLKSDSGYWLTRRALTVPTDATVYHAFVQACAAAGITYAGAESGYVRSITNRGVTLGEFDKGPSSGWLYKVNGELPQVGLTGCELNAGDEIVWYYTNDWTRDSSAGSYMSPTSEINPSASVSGGVAGSKVTASQVSVAIGAAEDKGESAVTIAPKNTGSAAEVSVSLPAASAEKIADAGLDLTVETKGGSVTIPNDALAEIAEKAGGDSLVIYIAQKTAADVTDKAIDTTDAIIAEVTVKSGDKTITEFGGHSIDIVIPVSGSFVEGQRYAVIEFLDDGTQQALTGICGKADGVPIVRVSVKGLSTFVVTKRAVMPFDDIAGHWGYDAIEYAYVKGLMEGDGKSFDPEGTLQRAMLVTVLYRLEGEPAVTAANPFTDVAAGQWYTDAVIWAYENKIAEGYGNDLFGPIDRITREQTATTLYNYTQFKEYGAARANDLSAYTDASEVSPWALDAIRWANAEGLVTGRTDTTLVPVGDANRAECAAILMRYIENITK